MLDVHIEFPRGTRVRADIQAISSTSLHAHPDALEIVYVLQGALQVGAGSESFDLVAGDYVVLNLLDPHVLIGSADNVTALVHVDIAAYHDVHPRSEEILFACESFDLARYRRQETLLRGMLLDIIEDAAVVLDEARLDQRAAEFVGQLCAGYSLADYYQRDRPVTGVQREKLLSILGYIRAHLDSRDLLQEVAREHHYSKSYVSHFVKDTAAISFSGAVTALRVMAAERLLLTTEQTMREVSTRCGFSDVKYFTRCFVDWFSQTPAEYRSTNQPITQRDNNIRSVAMDVTVALVRDHRRRVASPSAAPRLSITPILLRNVGSRADLFEKVRRFAPDHQVRETEPGAGERENRRSHYLPMRIGPAEVESGYLLSGLASFEDIHVTPCLVLEYSSREATLALIAAVARQLHEIGRNEVPVWLMYCGLHARDAVDQLIDVARDEYGLAVQAILAT